MFEIRLKEKKRRLGRERFTYRCRIRANNFFGRANAYTETERAEQREREMGGECVQGQRGRFYSRGEREKGVHIAVACDLFGK